MSLSKYQENFLGVLDQKRLENRFLWQKKIPLLIFQSPS
jgi:hypothetical protein